MHYFMSFYFQSGYIIRVVSALDFFVIFGGVYVCMCYNVS